MSATLPPLYLITDADRLGEERVLEGIRYACEGGLRMVQLREPTWSAARLGALGRNIMERSASGLSLVVSCHAGEDFSSRLSLAERLDVRGVHVGGGEPACVGQAREILGKDALVGYSAHSAAEAAGTFALGADYVSLSPVFQPLSKEGRFEALGLEELERACSLLDGPVYALGGVTPGAAASIRAAGAAGTAVITALLEAEDPASVSSALCAPWADPGAGHSRVSS